jgi:hypothetical protein
LLPRSTLVLCWSQLVDNTACQWVPIALNLAVHVAMYYYYAAREPCMASHASTSPETLAALLPQLATLGRSVWWKRHLTGAQILQFAIDVPSCAAALLLRMNAERAWGWFRGANTYCRGTHRAAYVGIGLLAIYLLLFIQVRCALGMLLFVPSERASTAQLYFKTYVVPSKRAAARDAAPRRRAALRKEA